MNYKSYKELDVWLVARELAKEVYRITTTFPKEEMYGIVNQMRRSAVSISSNIAEGFGRNSKTDSIRFFIIARGSLFELETQLYISLDLNFISKEIFDTIILKLDHDRKLLSRLIRYFKNSENLK